MNLSRRSFFGVLAGVPIAAALDVNPLATKIFLPPRGGWPDFRWVGTVDFLTLRATADEHGLDYFDPRLFKIIAEREHWEFHNPRSLAILRGH